MNDISKNVPDAEVKADDKVESGFNRTVVVASHGSGSAANRTMALNHSGIFEHKSKKAVEDIVGGVDINPYISLNLDVSSELESSLDAVESKYAMLTAFAEGVRRA